MKQYKEYALMLISFAGLLAIVAATVYGQQGFGRRGVRGGSGGEPEQNYDPAQAVVISGYVTALKDTQSKNGTLSGAGLELATDEGAVNVFLGPHIYVDFGNFRINPGDHIGIVGVRTMADEQPLFIAGAVRKGDEVLKLRDDKGQPLWGKGGSKQRGSWK